MIRRLIVICALMLTACSSPDVKRAEDSFIYTYPLVMTELTRQSMAQPNNVIRHRRDFPDHTFRTVIRPNRDTLYSVAWLDLGDDAVVMSVPTNDDRYFLMPVLDAWSNVFASIGSRRADNPDGLYLFTGPNWSGEVPHGMTQYRSPTEMAWVIGRIYTSGPEDFSEAHAFQDRITVQTLEAHNAGATPIAIAPTPHENALKPLERIREMSAKDYFDLAERLLHDNGPLLADQDFVAGTVTPLLAKRPTTTELEKAKAKAYRRFGFVETLLNRKKGWSGMTGDRPIGQYGTDYKMRATVAHIGFGANEPADAIYPNTKKDVNGAPLSGDKIYRLHFDAEALPPVNGFWSLTVYGTDQFLLDTPRQRYVLGGRDVVLNADGSLDITISAERPADVPEANWLSTRPGEDFALTMRLYWPKEAALNGDWLPPDITPVD